MRITLIVVMIVALAGLLLTLRPVLAAQKRANRWGRDKRVSLNCLRTRTPGYYSGFL